MTSPDQLLVPLGAWVERAACAGTAGFTQDPPEAAAIDAAVRVCGRCPVREDCAGYASDIRPTFGVWAGTWRGQLPARITAVLTA